VLQDAGWVTVARPSRAGRWRSAKTLGKTQYRKRYQIQVFSVPAYDLESAPALMADVALALALAADPR